MLGQDDLLTQKIELILEMNSKKMLSEMTKLRDEIGSLKEEVAGLRKATRFGSGAPEAPVERQQHREAPSWQQAPQQPAPSREPAAAQHPWAAAKEREAQLAAAEPPRRMDQPIDRNNVAPETVSIEKMFYFGNKR